MKTPFVIFEISGNRYGLNLLDVQGIYPVPRVIPLPKAPSIIEGIVNIHGKVLPVLDLRSRFRLPPVAIALTDHLIAASAGLRNITLRVDQVTGIEYLDPGDIVEASLISPHAEYVTGVAKHNEGLVLIQDLESFLSEAESLHLDSALKKAPPSP